MIEVNLTQEQGRVPVAVIHIKGVLNIETFKQFEKVARESIAAGAQYILVDLGGVTFLDSSGIRSLNSIFRTLDAAAGMNNEMAKSLLDGSYKSPHFKLLNPNSQVSEVLNLVGMDMFLEIHNDLRRAIDSF